MFYPFKNCIAVIPENTIFFETLPLFSNGT
jgi:hypothetical protein